MANKSDDAALVGMHVFERAGLGKAPFRCVGMDEQVFRAFPGAPEKAGGCCKYCGNGIRYVYQIKGADGSIFGVGSDCVERTGDAGLIRGYKTRPEARAMNRAKAKSRDERVQAEWAAMMADPDAIRALTAHTVPNWNNSGTRPWIEFATNAWRLCGAAGRAKYLRAAKQIIARPAA